MKPKHATFIRYTDESKFKPWERFCVRVERGSPDYFVVEIHETRKKMLEAITYADERKADRAIQAMCLSYHYTHGGKARPEQGTLYFYRGYIQPPVLAHEFFHAAMRWAWRRHMKLDRPVSTKRYKKDAEERVATAVQYMMEQFYELQWKRIFFIAGKDVVPVDVDKFLEKAKEAA